LRQFGVQRVSLETQSSPNNGEKKKRKGVRTVRCIAVRSVALIRDLRDHRCVSRRPLFTSLNDTVVQWVFARARGYFKKSGKLPGCPDRKHSIGKDCETY
jgi:hypothetical protein